MPIVIGIAGGTGAGKTTLARSLYRNLGEAEHVSYLMHDSYYKDISHLTLEERGGTNFDHPDSLDTHLMIEHVRSLKQGQAVHVPVYDFHTHSRLTSQVTLVEPRKIILVEGILVFSNPELVAEFDIKVFVDCDSDLRLMRRIARDTTERGRTVHDVMEQYRKTARPMHEQYVEPFKHLADLIVHSMGTHSGEVALKMLTNHLKAEEATL